MRRVFSEEERGFLRVFAGVEPQGRPIHERRSYSDSPPVRAEMEDWWNNMIPSSGRRTLTNLLKLSSDKSRQWGADDLEKVSLYLRRAEAWS